MQFAHMIGEHKSDRVSSWVFFGISVVVAAGVSYFIYKRAHKTVVKEEFRRK